MPEKHQQAVYPTIPTERLIGLSSQASKQANNTEVDTVPKPAVDTCLRTVITGEGAPNTRAGLILKAMVMLDTRTCDACGRRYTFTSYKDRCPVCCPKQDDKTDEYELDDWGSGDDLTAESE